MSQFASLFGRRQSVILGMVHLKALPGSPRCALSVDEICKAACQEAEIYKTANVDGIIIENMHDVPWQRPDQLGPEIVSSMAVIACKLRSLCHHLPIGIQVLSAGNKQALAVAKAAGLNFIRAEGFVFSHIGDEGPTHSCAAELLRYRKHIAADHIQIYTDIKKKHCSHALTADVSITETAKAAQLFQSDGVIITGTSTGEATNTQEVKDVQQCVNIPVMVGSGVNQQNVNQYMSANAMIVGSSFKQHGQWDNDLETRRVEDFMRTVNKLRAEKI